MIKSNRTREVLVVKYYNKLLKYGCFTWEELCMLVGNDKTAETLARSYIKKGYIAKVRRGLYVAVDLLTKDSVVSKFRIGSKITPSSYISHHAALEYYGCANQVSYQVEVSSSSVFSSFDYADFTYYYLNSRINDGITTSVDGVRVTDIERTIIDNLNDFEKIMGLEELLRCLTLVPLVQEAKLLDYLKSYNKQYLYQKAGYILFHYKDMWNLSDDFFHHCESRVGKSKRYLIKPTDNSKIVYNRQWKLITPVDLMRILEKGVTEDADI